MRRIDSHHHLWRLSRGDYGWLTAELGPIFRDFEADDLAPLLERHGISGTVLVQAAESEAETRFLLALAEQSPWIEGVVGWVDLAHPDAPSRIAALARHPALKGVRAVLQDLADDDFICRPDVTTALAAVEAAGLRLDLLVRPRHLSRVRTLRERFPGLPMLVDHGAKPDIAGGATDPWAADLRAVAADGRTHCKLSGLVTEAGPDWSTDRLRPYADTILDAFGPDRVLWGSDWPVLTLAGSYDQWVEASGALLAGLAPGERAAVWGESAIRFYGLNP
jgi:L-fuconolactonase